MGFTEKFQKSLEAVSMVIWIVLVPVVLDTVQLFSYQRHNGRKLCIKPI